MKKLVLAIFFLTTFTLAQDTPKLSPIQENSLLKATKTITQVDLRVADLQHRYDDAQAFVKAAPDTYKQLVEQKNQAQKALDEAKLTVLTELKLDPKKYDINELSIVQKTDNKEKK